MDWTLYTHFVYIIGVEKERGKGNTKKGKKGVFGVEWEGEPLWVGTATLLLSLLCITVCNYSITFLNEDSEFKRSEILVSCICLICWEGSKQKRAALNTALNMVLPAFNSWTESSVPIILKVLSRQNDTVRRKISPRKKKEKKHPTFTPSIKASPPQRAHHGPLSPESHQPSSPDHPPNPPYTPWDPCRG